MLSKKSILTIITSMAIASPIMYSSSTSAAARNNLERLIQSLDPERQKLRERAAKSIASVTKFEQFVGANRTQGEQAAITRGMEAEEQERKLRENNSLANKLGSIFNTSNSQSDTIAKEQKTAQKNLKTNKKK